MDRGAAILRWCGALYPGQIRKPYERCAGASQIAVPSRQRRADEGWRPFGATGGPAMRGGATRLDFARFWKCFTPAPRPIPMAG